MHSLTFMRVACDRVVLKVFMCSHVYMQRLYIIFITCYTEYSVTKITNIFFFSYHLMQSCWKRYSSERPHFDQIVTILTNFLARVKRPGSGYYSDSDSEDGEANAQPGKLPSRTPSIRSGMHITKIYY